MTYLQESKTLKEGAVGRRVTHAFVWKDTVHFIFDNDKGIRITGVGNMAIYGHLSANTVRRIFADIRKEAQGILALLCE